MGEEVTLAGRLRALASDVEAGASQAVAIQLREVAKEWERLDPVRDRLQELAVATRAWAPTAGGLGTIFQPELARVLAAQEALENAVEEALERWRTCSQCNVDRHVCPGCGASLRHGDTACQGCSPSGWVPATWAEVTAGDRVRIGQAEATVEVALPLTWVGSGASQIQVKLEGRPQPYAMPPSGPVERWVEPEPADWAADAFRILERAGLGAEVISHG